MLDRLKISNIALQSKALVIKTKFSKEETQVQQAVIKILFPSFGKIISNYVNNFMRTTLLANFFLKNQANPIAYKNLGEQLKLGGIGQQLRLGQEKIQEIKQTKNLPACEWAYKRLDGFKELTDGKISEVKIKYEEKRKLPDRTNEEIVKDKIQEKKEMLEIYSKAIHDHPSVILKGLQSMADKEEFGVNLFKTEGRLVIELYVECGLKCVTEDDLMVMKKFTQIAERYLPESESTKLSECLEEQWTAWQDAHGIERD